MICLAVDTTTENLYTALIKGDELYTRTLAVGKSGHSKALLSEIDALLKLGGTDISDVDTVAAAVGPGSFTGIRIGVAAMTAIAFANNAKRISVTSFELIAYNRTRVCAAVDAGHGNTYVARCKDGVAIECEFFESGAQPDGLVFDTLSDRCETLAKVAIKKAAENNFTKVLEPFYMRKSQAEREKDEI